MSEAYAIGIDIGGSGVKAVAITPDGRLLREMNQSFDPNQKLEFAKVARGLVDQLSREVRAQIRALGLCAPGLAAPDQRSVACLPDRLPGIEGLDWTTYFQRELAVPVLNDAQAALLGEAWLGAAKGRTNILMLTLGTGVGGAAMVDGRLLRGHSGKAGHVGHISLDADGDPDICGTPGSLEDAIGNATIEKRTGGRFSRTHDLVRAYREGDDKAREIWLASVRALGAGIVSLANVLDPEIVVVGGGIAVAGDALFRPLRETVERMEWKVAGHSLKLVPAELGDQAGAVGAAHYALQKAA